MHTCADPESFVGGGPLLTTFFFSFVFLEGREDPSQYHYKRAIIDPPAKRHLNGVSMACRYWPKIECWLGILVIFQAVWTSSTKKPYNFVTFRGGGVGSGPPVPLLDPPMAHERLCRWCVHTTRSGCILFCVEAQALLDVRKYVRDFDRVMLMPA